MVDIHDFESEGAAERLGVTDLSSYSIRALLRVLSWRKRIGVGSRVKGGEGWNPRVGNEKGNHCAVQAKWIRKVQEQGPRCLKISSNYSILWVHNDRVLSL